jgi:hypothetical protein
VVLAEALRTVGRLDEAAATLDEALRRYEEKGNLVSAGRVRATLAEWGWGDAGSLIGGTGHRHHSAGVPQILKPGHHIA